MHRVLDYGKNKKERIYLCGSLRILCVSVVIGIAAFLWLGCVQPGTPIPEHRIRGLPRDFPPDFPLHLQFSVAGNPRKLDWPEGDYFLVKFTTKLKPHDIHYFFRKELTTDRGYELLRESRAPGGTGIITFEKGPRHVEVTIGREEGVNTILLRLKDRK